jgi:hypothetical protein
MKKLIHCECGEIIGCYPVFSHQHDDQDTGAAEYFERYGGTANGSGFCVNCYDQAAHKARQREEAAI